MIVVKYLDLIDETSENSKSLSRLLELKNNKSISKHIKFSYAILQQ